MDLLRREVLGAIDGNQPLLGEGTIARQQPRLFQFDKDLPVEVAQMDGIDWV